MYNNNCKDKMIVVLHILKYNLFSKRNKLYCDIINVLGELRLSKCFDFFTFVTYL